MNTNRQESDWDTVCLGIATPGIRRSAGSAPMANGPESGPVSMTNRGRRCEGVAAWEVLWKRGGGTIRTLAGRGQDRSGGIRTGMSRVPLARLAGDQAGFQRIQPSHLGPRPMSGRRHDNKKNPQAVYRLAGLLNSPLSET